MISIFHDGWWLVEPFGCSGLAIVDLVSGDSGFSWQFCGLDLFFMWIYASAPKCSITRGIIIRVLFLGSRTLFGGTWSGVSFQFRLVVLGSCPFFNFNYDRFPELSLVGVGVVVIWYNAHNLCSSPKYQLLLGFQDLGVWSQVEFFIIAGRVEVMWSRIIYLRPLWTRPQEFMSVVKVNLRVVSGLEYCFSDSDSSPRDGGFIFWLVSLVGKFCG